MFKNISPAHIPQTGIQVRDTQNAPSNEGTATADTENVSPAVIPQTGTKRQVSGTVPSNVDGTPVIDIPQIGMQNGSIPSNEEASRRYAESIPAANIPKGMQAQLARNAPSTISVAQLLAGVKDRNGKPLSEADEREIKKELPVYSRPGLDSTAISNDGAVSAQGNDNVGVAQERSLHPITQVILLLLL